MRRLVISLSSTSLLIGGVIAAASVGVSAERPQTIPSTEPSVVTTEVTPTTEAPATTEGPGTAAPATEAPAATDAPAATEAPETSAATETTEADTAAGPSLVGAWLMTDASDPTSSFVASFSSDGLYHQADPDGGGIGAWEPTGPSSAAVTIVLPGSEDEGGGLTTIRANIEVGADGQTLTADYTLETSGAGAPPGEFGPGSVTGTRIVVEPMGTPVGSLDDLFGQFAPPATVPADTGLVTETTSLVTETTSAA